VIPRYTTSDMSAIWSDDNKFRIWLEVETLALEQMVKDGIAPKEAIEAVREKANFKVERVLEIEQEVKHDVIAFLTNVAEYVGPYSRYLHRGMTSSDLLDTSFAVQLCAATNIIQTKLENLLEILKEKAEMYRHTPCIGRSHGIHAEPTTFGLKLIGWYAEIKRHQHRLQYAKEEIAVGKIAGAVGTYASIAPDVEAYVLATLGLKPETVATQIVQRDRHALYFSALAQLATSIEKFAVEIHGQQKIRTPKRMPIIPSTICNGRLTRSIPLFPPTIPAISSQIPPTNAIAAMKIVATFAKVSGFTSAKIPKMITNIPNTMPRARPPLESKEVPPAIAVIP